MTALPSRTRCRICCRTRSRSESRAVRGNRGKVITILMKTWLTVPAGLEALRERGVEPVPGTERQRPDCPSLGHGVGCLSLLERRRRLHGKAPPTSGSGHRRSDPASGPGTVRGTANRITSRPDGSSARSSIGASWPRPGTKVFMGPGVDPRFETPGLSPGCWKRLFEPAQTGLLP